MIYNDLYGLSKFDSLMNLIKSDSDKSFQMRAIVTEDKTRLIILCCFIQGLPVFIDFTEITEQDYQDNKQQIEQLNCYIIDY